jgi:hypothetical protein
MSTLGSPHATSLGRRNRLFGWSLFLIGVVYGMALGTFVFNGPAPAPERFADYASLPRRLIRFAHIACMALGMVNVLYGHEVDRLRLSERWRRVGSWSMILSGTLMPIFLTLAAFQLPWKWGLPVPATAALLAVAVLVAGLARKEQS